MPPVSGGSCRMHDGTGVTMGRVDPLLAILSTILLP